MNRIETTNAFYLIEFSRGIILLVENRTIQFAHVTQFERDIIVTVAVQQQMKMKCKLYLTRIILSN